MKESKLRKVHAVATIALVLGAPVIANAAHSDVAADESGIRVSYSDLNLNTGDGIAVLYKRLQNASDRACYAGAFQQKGSVREAVEARTCYNDVLARSVAKVGNADLTAVHES